MSGRVLMALAVGVLPSVLVACSGLLDPDAPGNLVPRTVAEDASLPRIAIGGTLLHAEAFGNPADPIVMVLHGGPGSDYRALLPLRALADEGYYVVFWDQRGAGLSQRHDADAYTFEGYLEDLRLVLEHYTHTPGQPVAFIGHSWGAMYATWFINEYGDYGGRIRGAILSEPGAFTKAQLDRYNKAFMGSVDFLAEGVNDLAWLHQLMSPAEQARADYIQMVASASINIEHNDPRNPTPHWRTGSVVNARLLQIAKERGFDWTTNLSRYRQPVLFLRSDLFEANPLAHQQELASSYPAATIVTIRGVGHQMIWERPAEYLAQTRAYFRRIGFLGGAS